MKFTRRDTLKASGMALGALAVGGARKVLGQCLAHVACYPTSDNTQYYKWFYDSLPTMDFTQTPVVPGTPRAFSTPTDTPPLDPNEMRITFMGSCTPLLRRAQALMSIFVEVGWQNNKAVDQVIFDCGSGCTRNYSAMGVGYGRMDKIFINHLHADHTADLSHIYCFGPSLDRLSPLYVFGQSPSGVQSPRPPRKYYDDGINAFCANLREAWRWHTESFSFQNTSYDHQGNPLPTQKSWGLPVKPVPVSDDPPDDGYAMIPIQLDWTQIGGVAYNNPDTGLKVTHFPVIHCRRGSMGYKLEWYGPNGSWDRPLSMIYTSDTKPETNTILQANNAGKGVDVLIHEMIVPPEIWAMEFSHYCQPGSGPTWDNYISRTTEVQNSSHTPQGAFGYLLSRINPRPRLTVATHFPVSDDTIACALASVNKHCPDITDLGQGLTWSFDLMVLRVYPDRIEQYRANVLDYGFTPLYAGPDTKLCNTPKYHDAQGNGDPYAQIDKTYQILPGTDTFCEDGY